MKKNLEQQEKYTCKIIWREDISAEKREKFFLNARKHGFLKDEPQGDSFDLELRSSLERKIITKIAKDNGCQVKNTNHDGE